MSNLTYKEICMKNKILAALLLSFVGTWSMATFADDTSTTDQSTGTEQHQEQTQPADEQSQSATAD